MEYVCTDRPIELAAEYVAETIKNHLSLGEQVLWLLTGGSGIPIAVLASKKIEGLDLSKLSVTLTDERFGPIGHKDENWQHLLDKGLNLPGANLYRPSINDDMGTTSTQFANWLNEQLIKSDYSLGIFGLGTDGHTAGIKPHSPAVAADSLVVSYHGDDFDRVTISFNAIKQIEEAVLQVSGDDKRNVLNEFIYDDLPLNEQPAQILKTIPHLTIYSNNAKEEK